MLIRRRSTLSDMSYIIPLSTFALRRRWLNQVASPNTKISYLTKTKNADSSSSNTRFICPAINQNCTWKCNSISYAADPGYISFLDITTPTIWRPIMFFRSSWCHIWHWYIGITSIFFPHLSLFLSLYVRPCPSVCNIGWNVHNKQAIWSYFEKWTPRSWLRIKMNFNESVLALLLLLLFFLSIRSNNWSERNALKHFSGWTGNKLQVTEKERGRRGGTLRGYQESFESVLSLLFLLSTKKCNRMLKKI